MNDDLNKDQKFVGMLTEIILANLDNENFGVNELARQAGMSHFVLSRKLYSAAGKTISQFIRETRLKKALELLQGGDITAAEVAYKTGFGSPTYFNTCFNEFFGYPPGAVKKGEVKSNNETKVLPEIDKQQHKVNFLVVSSLLIIVVLVIILGYHILKEKSSDSASDRSALQEKSVAVLPFNNLSDSAGNQYFADGITEEILTLLSKIRNLRVLSRTSVEQFRDTKFTVSEIAEKLKVKYLIEGSVQKSGNKFRLWIQLIDATNGNHIWAEVYDGNYTIEIFEFQSNVARKVAASMNTIIIPAEAERINAKPTNEILAYDFYLRGQDLLRKSRYTKDSTDLKLAFSALNEAIKIDPEFIQAIRYKAMAFTESGDYDSSLYYNRKANILDPAHPNFAGIGVVYMYSGKSDSAFKYLQMAIDKNPYDPWANLALGQIYYIFRKDVLKSLFYMHKAYELAGESEAEICNSLGWGYFYIGDYQKSLMCLRNALSLRSECQLVIECTQILVSQRKFDEAIHFLDSACNITTCDKSCDINKFQIYLSLNEFEKAEIYYKNAINSGYKRTADDIIYLAYLYKETGRVEEALLLLNNSILCDNDLLEGKIRSWDWVNIKSRLAAAHALKEENEKTLKYLSEVGNASIFGTPFNINSFPGFDKLRSVPEFKALIKHNKNEQDSLKAQVKQMELRGEIHL